MDQESNTTRKLIQFLSNKGYRVEQSNNAERLLDYVKQDSIDVLILDVSVGSSNGAELISMIKNIDRLLPIIVTSTDDSIEVAAHVREQGIFFYTIKPLDMEEIALAVENALNRRYSRRIPDHCYDEIASKKNNGDEQLMTIHEASSFLRLRPRTLQRLSRQGAIPAIKIGLQWYFIKDQITRWLRMTANNNQRDLHALVFDVLDEGVAVINKRMQLLSCNQAYMRLLNCGEQQGIDEQHSAVDQWLLVPGGELAAPVRQAFVSRDIVRCTCTDRSIRGQQRYFDIVALPVKNARGHVDYVVEVVRDTTQLYDTNRHLNWIMEFFVHECKGTLGPVMLNISALADPHLAGKINNETKQSMLLSSLCSIKFLHDMIRNYIVSYNVEQGRLPCCPRFISFKKDLIEPCLSEFQPVLHKRTMGVSVLADDGCRLFCDPELFRIAIGNLVNNAIKYGTEGTTVVCRATDDHDCVEIQILNEGLGIAPDALSSVFERFIRFDKVGVSGTGLGLHIVKKIVEQHGGTVRADAGFIIDGRFVVYKDVPDGMDHATEGCRRFAAITMKVPHYVPQE